MENLSLFFRSAFLFDDNIDITRQRYIAEITKALLFESESGQANIKEIYKHIKETLGIEFALEEIREALDQYLGTIIDKKHDNDDTYCITSEGFEQVCKNKEKLDLKKHIEKFFNSQTIESFSASEAQDIIIKYIYEQFNKSAASISSILTGTLLEFDSCKYTHQQKELINAFLNWKDADKNKCIFTAISRAYDFCVITGTEDKSVYDFSNCEFYLDTNIVIRLAGLNNETRMELIDRFISRCKEKGICLKYTSFTKEEIYQAINTQVRYIEEICRDYSLIAPSEMCYYAYNNMSEGFYKDFYQWSKKNKSQNNYPGYKSYLYEKIDRILSGFQEETTNISYFASPNGYDIRALFASIKECMPIKSDPVIKTDLNNILYVHEKFKKTPEHQISFITADNELISWTRQTFISQSLAELPSVWLSIILKFSGRTSDKDFESFCKFINLRITPQNNTLEDKLDLLACVQICTTDQDLKNMVLKELRINSSKYQQYNTPEYKVKAALEYTIDSIKDETTREVYAQSNENSAKEIERIKISLEKEKLQFIEEQERQKKIELESSYQNAKNEGNLESIERIASSKATKRIRLFYIIATIFSIAIFIIAVILIYCVITGKVDLQRLDLLLTICSIAASVIGATFLFIIFERGLCRCDKTALIRKLIFKIGNKHKIDKEIINEYCEKNNYKAN